MERIANKNKLDIELYKFVEAVFWLKVKSQIISFFFSSFSFLALFMSFNLLSTSFNRPRHVVWRKSHHHPQSSGGGGGGGTLEEEEASYTHPQEKLGM
jgi:hypothetical protein